MSAKKSNSEKKKSNKGSKVSSSEVAKGPWKKEEDRLLQKLVAEYGAKDWSSIAQHMASVGVVRKGKQCRERWYNHLSPDVRKDAWTPKEDEIIIKAHLEFGNKWTKISRMLDGRPANAIKNHWNATLRRRLEASSKQTRKSDDEEQEITTRKKRRREESNEFTDLKLSFTSLPKKLLRKSEEECSPRQFLNPPSSGESSSCESVISDSSPYESPRSPRNASLFLSLPIDSNENSVSITDGHDSPQLLDYDGAVEEEFYEQLDDQLGMVIHSVVDYDEDSLFDNSSESPQKWNYDSSWYDLQDDINWQGNAFYKSYY